jgi:hypothetical protein
MRRIPDAIRMVSSLTKSTARKCRKKLAARPFDVKRAALDLRQKSFPQVILDCSARANWTLPNEGASRQFGGRTHSDGQ